MKTNRSCFQILHTYTHTYTQTHIHTYSHTNTYTYTHTQTHTNTQTHKHTNPRKKHTSEVGHLGTFGHKSFMVVGNLLTTSVSGRAVKKAVAPYSYTHIMQPKTALYNFLTTPVHDVTGS